MQFVERSRIMNVCILLSFETLILLLMITWARKPVYSIVISKGFFEIRDDKESLRIPFHDVVYFEQLLTGVEPCLFDVTIFFKPGKQIAIFTQLLKDDSIWIGERLARASGAHLILANQ